MGDHFDDPLDYETEGEYSLSDGSSEVFDGSEEEFYTRRGHRTVSLQ